MIQTNEIELTDLSLSEQIVQECLAMAKYAFASGLKIPEKVVKVLEIIMPCQPGEVESKENKTNAHHERIKRHSWVPGAHHRTG